MAQIPIGLQFYTLREDAQRDFVGTLKQVAALGYAGVEFAGYGELSAAQLRAVLDDLGMASIGAHVPLEVAVSDINAVIDYHLTLGSATVTIPWLAESLRGEKASWLSVAAQLREIGAACRAQGLQLCYHNHDFEFARFDGVYALDLLYDAVDPALLQAELDLYWVKKAGEDPAAYVKKFAGRVPLLHIKDMANDADGSFAEFGEGVIDWEPVFAAAPAAGVRWYIVEQDRCLLHPCLESVAISMANLKKRGMA
jgi:sugar phosphate isomerase/epimerase